MGCIHSKSSTQDAYVVAKERSQAVASAKAKAVELGEVRPPAARCAHTCGVDDEECGLLQQEDAAGEEQSTQLMVVLNEAIVYPEDEDVRWETVNSYNILDTVRRSMRLDPSLVRPGVAHRCCWCASCEASVGLMPSALRSWRSLVPCTCSSCRKRCGFAPYV